MTAMKTEEKLDASLKKELEWVMKRERKLLKKAEERERAFSSGVEEKIPEGVRNNLKKGFSMAFRMIFEKGSGIIEKSLNREAINREFTIGNMCVEAYGCRKDLKRLKKTAKKTDFITLTVSAAEGAGLGVLGIGLPDIAIFLATVFRGIYETALNYGFGYDTDAERYFMLTLIKGAVLCGKEATFAYSEADALINDLPEADKEELKKKTDEAANVLASELLFMKFIQGIPVVGVLGGIMNPVYYSRIMKYVRLKYHKRYIRQKMNKRKEENQYGKISIQKLRI